MSDVVIAFWSQILAFVAFAIFIVWVWKRFIEPAVIGARDAANRSVAEAERHRDEALSALELMRNEIAGAQRDADAIRQRAIDQARREHVATVAEAKEAGERQLHNASGELARARLAARERLRDELLSKTLVLAREQAAEKIDARVNSELVEGFVESLERGARN